MHIYKIIETFSVLDCFILISLALLLYIFRFYFTYFTRPNPLPGPLPLPFGIECLYLVKTNKNFTAILHQKYGDIFEFTLGGHRRIVLSRIDYVEKILISSTKNLTFFSKYPFSQGLVELEIYGQGIFMNNNWSSWKHNNRYLSQAIQSPSFSREAVMWANKLFEELDGYWQSLAKHQSSDASNDNWLELDFLKWFLRFTNDMISIVATGERTYAVASYYNTLSPVKSEHQSSIIENSEEFIKMLKKFLMGHGFFMFGNPFMRHYVPTLKAKAKYFLDNRDSLFEVLDNIIKRRKKEINEVPSNATLRHDLLTSFITANDELFQPMTDKEIRIVLLDVFMAGTESTADAFIFIIYYLCHYPHVKQRMLAEIDSYFSNHSHVTIDIFETLTYCEAIIKEVLRLVPVLGAANRYATAECEVAGYKWPAGTMFHPYYAGINMHKKYWSNPSVFDPDRFYMGNGFMYTDKPEKNSCEKDTKINTNTTSHKFSSLAFGTGLRMCSGKKLAMIELLSLMALVFRKYDVELVDMQAPLNTTTIVTTFCNELRVKIRPRN